MKECSLCGQDTRGYGPGDEPICLDCYRDRPGLLREVVQNVHLEQPPNGNGPSLRHVEFDPAAVSDGSQRLREHLSANDIRSPKDAAERLRNQLSEINTRKFAAECLFHFLIGQGVGRGMGQDLSFPPHLTKYILGLVTTTSGDGKSEYSFYRTLEYSADVLGAFSQLEWNNKETRQDQGEKAIATFGPITSELITGDFAHADQHIQVAKMAYGPHKPKMREILGFDIYDALEFIGKLNEFYTLLFNELMTDSVHAIAPELLYCDFLVPNRCWHPEKYEDIQEARVILDDAPLPADNLWVERSTLERLAPSNKEAEFSAFLDRMTVELGTDNGYRLPSDHNPLDATPLIENDSRVLSPLTGQLNEVAAKTFFFDLFNDEDYRGEFTNSLGDFVESWVLNSLTHIFDSERILSGIDYPGGETDILIISDDTLIVVECKRKGLTSQTSAGGELGYQQIESDLREGIGKAYNQASDFISKLDQNENLEIASSNGRHRLNSNHFTNAIICIVLGDSYDMLGTTQFAQILEFDSQIPYVVDIYDLETICRHLQNETAFVDYLKKRIDISEENRIQSPDEIDYLHEYLQNGLEFDMDSEFGTVQITNPGNDLRSIHDDASYRDWNI